MKIILMVLGKTLTESLADEIEKYARRITHYLPFEIKVIPDIKKGKTFDPLRQKTAEVEQNLNKNHRANTVILLDEIG
ncbi:MAG: 23S rRNA (pseudouridine(1915)-N(3))-methyltransferase RlmH, partial [Muribaculaceae bacterium]|nr:23S rRNA (pseudouridine(1915)-N(3))-methyltransferase RlmH [Muribaculaceae bacterium]